jgi:hypothetical protein
MYSNGFPHFLNYCVRKRNLTDAPDRWRVLSKVDQSYYSCVAEPFETVEDVKRRLGIRDTITNPKTGNRVTISGSIGKQVLEESRKRVFVMYCTEQYPKFVSYVEKLIKSYIRNKFGFKGRIRLYKLDMIENVAKISIRIKGKKKQVIQLEFMDYIKKYYKIGKYDRLMLWSMIEILAGTHGEEYDEIITDQIVL